MQYLSFLPVPTLTVTVMKEERKERGKARLLLPTQDQWQAVLVFLWVCFYPAPCYKETGETGDAFILQKLSISAPITACLLIQWDEILTHQGCPSGVHFASTHASKVIKK